MLPANEEFSAKKSLFFSPLISHFAVSKTKQHLRRLNVCHNLIKVILLKFITNTKALKRKRPNEVLAMLSTLIKCSMNTKTGIAKKKRGGQNCEKLLPGLFSELCFSVHPRGCL